MKTKASDLPKFLDDLKKANEWWYQKWKGEDEDKNAESLRQIIFPAEPPSMMIPTLSVGICRPITPQLEERFRYAGSWINAVMGNAFLSIREMENVWNDESITEQIRIRQTYWETSPPATCSWDKISLFGLKRPDDEEIYLLWDDEKEPSVFSYVGNNENRFDDVGDFILFCCRTE